MACPVWACHSAPRSWTCRPGGGRQRTCRAGSPIRRAASAPVSMRSSGGRAGDVPRGDAVALGQDDPGQHLRGGGGGGEGHGAPVQRGGGHPTGEGDALHRAVAGDGQVREQEQVAGVAQVLHGGDGGHVQVALDQQAVELGGGAPGELHVQQGPVVDEPVVEGQAVEEGDVPHPGAGAHVRGGGGGRGSGGGAPGSSGARGGARGGRPSPFAYTRSAAGRAPGGSAGCWS